MLVAVLAVIVAASIVAASAVVAQAVVPPVVLSVVLSVHVNTLLAELLHVGWQDHTDLLGMPPHWV